jgi:RND family efflux transporter MFP subunit
VTRRFSPLRALRVPLLLAGAFSPAAGCGHAAAANPAPASEAPAPAPIHVAWITAEERLLPEQIVVTGDLRPESRIDVSAETEGRVVDAALERGQTVHAGDLLVELDQRDAKSRLAEAEAVQAQFEARLGLAVRGTFDPEQTPDVRLARVNMERAKTEAGRYERLVADGAVARSLHDVERANHEVAKERHAAEVDRMRETWRSLQAQQARVALARKAVEDTQIRAPWSGVVQECLVDEGQYVKKGERLAVLVKVDALRTALAIPESHAAAVRQGQKVALAVRSRPGEEFPGFVTWVGPGLDTASRSLTVEVLVDNADGRLQPGAFATARLDLPATRPSVVVAWNAIASANGVHHVFVIDGDRLEKRLVQIGRDVDSRVEVVRGLAAGEKVAIEGSARLIDGAIVAAAAVGE